MFWSLSEWSVVVQLGITSLLAFFFFALSRSLRLLEVRLWAKAWLANALALGAVHVAAFVGAPGVAGRLALAGYALGKTFFVLLIAAGMAQHLQPGRPTLLLSQQAWLFALAWSLAVGFLAPNLMAAQMAQASLVAAGFLAAAWWVWQRPRFPRSRWLALALFFEGSLFASYLYPLGQTIWAATPPVGLLPLTSFFDAGAELVLGMTMLMGLESSSTAQLRHLHEELVDSYERLRAVVMTDPLTGLANRLALEREASPSDGQVVTVIFFDVDNFKEINDRHGHLAGDACLVTAAKTLVAKFRPEDRVFRWGGDEFLVLAAGLELPAAEARCQAVARALADCFPPATLSVGMSFWLPGQPLAEALALADAAMYRQKGRTQAS